jgi:dTDP-4-dehydrorhamnose 3,5-epimerase
VPRGFAHGFVVLSETAEFFYKCDELYSPAQEITVRWNDPAIGIAWGIEAPSLSVRDATAPLLAEIGMLPEYGACTFSLRE